MVARILALLSVVSKTQWLYSLSVVIHLLFGVVHGLWFILFDSKQKLITSFFWKSVKKTILIFVTLINMRKRGMKINEISLRPAKESKKHWSLGLVDSMKDPEAVYKETERLVVIRDKYPKARIHYLVLPREEIASIYKLNKTHVDLITEFGSMYQSIKCEHKENELKAGFHAVPSMQRLHMHVISKDMDSKCLKTKIHWNSFTTSFFIPYEDLLKRLTEDGCIERISSEAHKALMSTPLKCNQCSFEPKNMPQLKQHLLTHLK